MPTPDQAVSETRPRQRASGAPAQQIARIAVTAMQDKKAVDITVIDVRDVSGVTNYYVIGTGESDLQVRAIVEAIQEQVREAADERPWKKEGTDRLHWVVLDYVDVVVHVFDRERREFYDLERLWGDAPTEHVADDTEEVALLADDASAAR